MPNTKFGLVYPERRDPNCNPDADIYNLYRSLNASGNFHVLELGKSGADLDIGELRRGGDSLLKAHETIWAGLGDILRSHITTDEVLRYASEILSAMAQLPIAKSDERSLRLILISRFYSNDGKADLIEQALDCVIKHSVNVIQIEPDGDLHQALFIPQGVVVTRKFVQSSRERYTIAHAKKSIIGGDFETLADTLLSIIECICIVLGLKPCTQDFRLSKSTLPAFRR